ncbi:murein DD-endopeptidase MepM/ murein hydrolase activator NlpD [Amycolatopsis viridis]|uniref:Murein DD-endopeptidase MepM/ murein hydrolase activator NlpD n=2 Tax=Amycolatopsis viridis TaxID=185678 RepID=A0ABX0T2R9_9PSEU|nr:murein DD-endopeptidase MepM/ murein hydrolase activator NlpD [Amycolatopsis viridis]
MIVVIRRLLGALLGALLVSAGALIGVAAAAGPPPGSVAAPPDTGATFAAGAGGRSLRTELAADGSASPAEAAGGPASPAAAAGPLLPASAADGWAADGWAVSAAYARPLVPPAVDGWVPATEVMADRLEPRFGWPLSPPPAVVRPFQAPADPYGPGHRGVDLAAAPGQQVLAAGPGVVVFAGMVAGRPVVAVDHDGGLRTTYEPVTPTVPVGTQVWQGQPIGVVEAGHPGCPVEACLHWGVRRGEEYLNPLTLVQNNARIRLKPWDG